MGVFGLPWPPLSPKDHFGRVVQVALTLHTTDGTQVQTPATLCRERTFRSDWMGLSFQYDLSRDDRAFRTIRRAVELYGFYPQNYQRKTPRIPVSQKIQTFPLKVLGMLKQEGLSTSAPPIVFDVKNISLGGVLLSTENPHVFPIQLDDVLTLYFEPRGSFTQQIQVQAQVCRTIEEMHLASGNPVRTLGLRFVQMDTPQKAAYLDLIRDVVGRIRDGNDPGEEGGTE